MSLYMVALDDTIRSLMSKAWNILPRKKENLIDQLLFNRGIKKDLEKEKFFNPELDDFKKDLEIENILVAKKRILKAIKENALIFVSGDYDVDGICGAAILYLGLTQIGAKVLPYIPHREKEGYGLSKIGLDLAHEKGGKLIISVDCGIVDFVEAEYANSLGMDLIITDHHQRLKGKNPKSFTIVHSTKMCGSAVAWCLIKSLLDKDANKLLDLVSIAEIADMMPMVGVNRALVKSGLIKLNHTKRVGLIALIEESGLLLEDLGSYEIGHMLAPRLNAAGRLDSAMDSLRLLCTKSSSKASELARNLSEVNNTRKKLTTEAIESARLMIKEEKKIYVLSDNNWNPGIVGLIAGRICEETKRPTIAISIGEVHSKGSARSVDGINIVEVIRQCSDILVAVGGHPGAAGFTIQTSKIIEFQKRIEIILQDTKIGNVVLDIDAEVQGNQLNIEIAKEIEKFEPFGISNNKPLLLLKNAKITDLKTVGLEKHLKGKVEGIDFIAFGMGELLDVLQNGILADMVFNLEINKFNGRENVQLVLKDLKMN